MRSFPFTAATARGIHALLTIELFNSTLYLTTADTDITISGTTWSATGAVNITQILYTTDGTPAGADIRVAPDGTNIMAGWGAQGRFDGRPITVEIFDIADPDSGTYDMIPGAVIGSASEDSNGQITLAVVGASSLLNGPATEIYSTTCRAKFGDDRCKIPLDVPLVARGTAYITQASASSWKYTRQVWVRAYQSGSYHDLVYECTTAGTTHATVEPIYPTSAGSTVTDGTAVFTARAAKLVAATGSATDFFTIQLTATPSPVPTPLGNIIPQSGPLTGLKIPIRAFDSGTNEVTLFEPYATSNFPIGTSFLIHPGCDKLATTCRDDYSNLANFRGEPYAPAANILTGRA